MHPHLFITNGYAEDSIGRFRSPSNIQLPGMRAANVVTENRLDKIEHPPGQLKFNSPVGSHFFNRNSAESAEKVK